MTHTKHQNNMDATIKSAFDSIVKIVSRKMEQKKPKESAPDYILEDYGVLEHGLRKLQGIAKNPADYFENKYKDSVLGDLLEVSRLTGARFDRLLDSLILLSLRYYRAKTADKKKLEKDIEKLNKKIQLRAATGLVLTLGMALTPASKLVIKENQK